MDAHEVTDMITYALGANDQLVMVSFAGAGVMTNDAGFVMRLDDGSEFQVTVIQSRQSSS